ncbi:MAG: PAS domain S-box protein [Rhodospirillaceae bacterium]|nr:PAS domain S-box protein [Rhodospirillaceae bacterium]MBT7267504.1 PAS domain S-box protein [Rhodospirillaceae bacterium]
MVLTWFLIALLSVAILVLLVWNFRLRASKSQTDTSFLHLKSTDQDLISVLKRSPIGVGITIEGRPKFYNDKITELFGWQGDDLTSADVSAIYARPEERDAVIMDLKDKGFFAEKEILFKKSDGHLVSLLFSASLIEYDGHEAVLVWMYDITALNAAEQAISHGKEILQNSPIAVGISIDRKFKFINDRFSELTGWQAEDFKKKDGDMIFADFDQRLLIREELDKKGFVKDKEVAFYDASGEISQALFSAYRTIYEGEEAVIGWIYDISELTAAQKELSHAKEILEATIDSVDQGLVMIDGDYRIIANNRSFADIVWLDPEYLASYPLWEDMMRRANDQEWFGLDIDIEAMIETQRDMRSNAFEPIIARNTRSDGTEFEFWCKALSTGGWVQSVTDITERLRAEKEIARGKDILETTINSVNQGIIMVSEDGTVLAHNKYFETLHGMSVKDYSNYEEFGVAYLKSVGAEPKSIEESLQLLRVNKAGTWVRPINENLVFEISHTPLSDGGYVRTYNEITERLKAENILKRAKEDAEAAAEAKSEFVAVVSHEVRTPLNGVLGMARLLLETSVNEEQKQYAETIVRSGETLILILNDLLDISKLEAGKLDLDIKPFNPKEVIESSISLMSAKAQENKISLTISIENDLPSALLGDENRIRQVLINLISNAVKFTKEGSVTLSASATHQDDSNVQLMLSVKDTGSGISQASQANLFTPFTQGSADVARKYGGTGLGLAICRRLAELMSGKIMLESELGYGSTFSLNIPLRMADPDKIASNGKLSQNGDHTQNLPALKILLVEDNEINLKVARGLLQKRGHDVQTAENGQIALDILLAPEASEFDAILMDRHMPVMDGVEATRHIKEMDGPISNIPIIAVTAAVTQREIDACLEAGMTEVVTKPIHPEELMSALARACNPQVGASSQDPVSSKSGVLQDSKTTPILDDDILGTLRNNLGNDTVTELIEDFKIIGYQSIEQFKAAASEHDVEAMTRNAHDLKTNAATLGLLCLSERAREVEFACKENRMEDAKSLSTDLTATLEVSISTLEN